MTIPHHCAGLARAAGALLVLSLAPAARAQVTPMSVNDCTLLPDPGALRRCLDQAEGRVVTTPPPLTNATGLDQPTQGAQGTLPAAGPTAPNRGESNFLSGKTNRSVEPRPTNKNVIDLD
jgi:hypothetical protein